MQAMAGVGVPSIRLSDAQLDKATQIG